MINRVWGGGGGLEVSDSVRLMRVVWGFPVQVSEVEFFRV